MIKQHVLQSGRAPSAERVGRSLACRREADCRHRQAGPNRQLEVPVLSPRTHSDFIQRHIDFAFKVLYIITLDVTKYNLLYLPDSSI